MSQPTHEDVMRAQMTLVRDRLEQAARNGRGIGLNRSEIELTLALVALGMQSDVGEVIHQITKQEDAR